jgi:hypothetical protein
MQLAATHEMGLHPDLMHGLLLLIIKFNVHIEPLAITDTWSSAVAVGLCLQVVPRGPIGPFYLLYDPSSPFPHAWVRILPKY